MKFLVILYATYNNGDASKKAMYEYNTVDEAKAAFHSYLGSYMSNETVDHILCVAVDTDGAWELKESWTRELIEHATETEITE